MLNPNFIPAHTWTAWGTSAILRAISEYGASAVLYGSSAMNLYVPPQYRWQTQDIDVFVVCDTPNEFEPVVSHLMERVHSSLMTLSHNIRPALSLHMKFRHTDRNEHVTMSMSLNGRHVADFTRQLRSVSNRVTAVFPTKIANILCPLFGSFTISTVSIDESKHRLCATVACAPYIDGSEAMSADTNKWRIEKDSLRLRRILELEQRQLLLSDPCDFELGPSELRYTFQHRMDVLADGKTYIMPEALAVVSTPSARFHADDFRIPDFNVDAIVSTSSKMGRRLATLSANVMKLRVASATRSVRVKAVANKVKKVRADWKKLKTFVRSSFEEFEKTWAHAQAGFVQHVHAFCHTLVRPEYSHIRDP